MRSLYLAWTKGIQELTQAVAEIDGTNLPQAVGDLPWGHNLQLLSKLKDPAKRLWYAVKTKEFKICLFLAQLAKAKTEREDNLARSETIEHLNLCKSV